MPETTAVGDGVIGQQAARPRPDPAPAPDPAPSAASLPASSVVERRHVLAAGASGITALVLPSSSAAASDGDLTPSGLAEPSNLTAEPIGHIGRGTGGIRVDWSAVDGADEYEVRWSTMSTFGPYTDGSFTTTATSVDLTGLAGQDTTHHLVVLARSGSTSSLMSSPVSSSPVVGAGGTVSTFIGDGAIGQDGTTYVVHTFAAVGTFNGGLVLHREVSADHLVVAGGGGGGAHVGGGGGGGGVLSGTADRSGALDVVVGAGGAGASHPGGLNENAIRAQQGGDSSLAATVAFGGGSGGSWTYHPARDGGSGGGGGANDRGSGTSGQGFDGGLGRGETTDGFPTGGGGGAGGVGGQWSSASAGDGGIGRASTITGSEVRYGGGGGGGIHGWTLSPTATAGRGRDGGGDGAVQNASAQGFQQGANGRGGGGGGGGNPNNLTSAGGAGGSGAVIVRYALPAPALALVAAPSGYASAEGGTGAIGVSWSEVVGAQDYEVAWWRQDGGTAAPDGTVTTTDTSVTLTGLAGTDVLHHVVVTARRGETVLIASAATSAMPVIATGGTVSTFIGDGTIGTQDTTYVVHRFDAVGTAALALHRDISIDHLLIAGGGGGGGRIGGGGGAGGLLSGTSVRSARRTAYPVVVGAGGAGGAGVLGVGGDGADGSGSSVFGLAAVGGGGGAGTDARAGRAGGSGGGGSRHLAGGAGGAGTSGQGSAGGAGSGDPDRSGGGGGAGGAGAGGATGGAGGAGVDSSITGTAKRYAGGGGGAGYLISSGTGSDGGGSAVTAGAGGSGTAGTGGGGGGGGFVTEPGLPGGAGGSGIVILRYALPA